MSAREREDQSGAHGHADKRADDRDDDRRTLAMQPSVKRRPASSMLDTSAGIVRKYVRAGIVRKYVRAASSGLRGGDDTA